MGRKERKEAKEENPMQIEIQEPHHFVFSGKVDALKPASIQIPCQRLKMFMGKQNLKGLQLEGRWQGSKERTNFCDDAKKHFHKV